MNATASVLWAGFNGETSTEDVIMSFVAKFDAEHGRARRDALALIEELRDLELLQDLDR